MKIIKFCLLLYDIDVFTEKHLHSYKRTVFFCNGRQESKNGYFSEDSKYYFMNVSEVFNSKFDRTLRN